MKRLLALLTATLCGLISYAQLLTWSPPFPVENNPAQTYTITLDATKGNGALAGYTPATDVYVHIGAITNKSTNASDWKYVKFTWATTNPAANAASIGGNRWTYTITGSLRSYFGITDATETIQKIAILFRSGNGNTVQRNIDGSDMYLPIYSATEFAVRLSQPPRQPKFVPEPEPQPSLAVGSTLPVAADASKPSAMKLYHNGTVIATSAGNVTALSGSATITTGGNQRIVAEAADGSTTRYDTINLFVAPAGGSPVAALPAGMRDGINYGAGNTSATLVLRAPGKNMVTVIGEFNGWLQDLPYVMNKTPDGKFFWLTITGLTAGTKYAYQYVVDNSLRIADPYTEEVLDPGNDRFISGTTYPNLKAYPAGQTGIVSVLQPGATPYTWGVPNFNRPDKRGLVIYELLVRDFVAAHDWKTIQDSLNYLQTLGVNAIQLMPFNEFEGNSSWGYNPNFYFASDKYYGPPATLKRFIDSCHRRGIAVIMDIALNHSFGSAPMVQLYFDPVTNRPTAANPWFNPTPRHAFNVGYDMNHESLDTKYFFGRVVEHWLQEYKLDGFRFDLSKGFTQTQTCDANGNNCNVNGWSSFDASRVAIWKGYYDTLQRKAAGSYVILEHFADNNEERELSNYGMLLWGNLNHSYNQATMGYNTDWDFSGGIASVRGWTNPHLVTYAESHDEERLMYRNINFGNNSVAAHNTRDTTIALQRMEQTAAFLLTMPGPKMIWQFGELGYPYSINTCTNGTISNDCRLAEKPIRWDYLTDPRRRKVYTTYSALNRIRNHPQYQGAFLYGTTTQDFSGAFKWLRVTTPGDTADLVVIGNFGVTAQSGTVTFPTAGTWYNYFGNFIHTATGAAQTFTLQPGEFHVYVNRNLNGVTPTPVVNVPWNGSTLEAKAYPNPVADGAWQVELKLPQSGRTTIELFNSLGQRITTLYNGFQTVGTKVLPMPVLQSGKGVYYLKVTSATATKTVSITLQ